MPRGALAGVLPENAAPGSFELALARLATAGRIREEDDLVRLADFVPLLSQEQEARTAHLRASAMAAGLEPPTPKEWAEELGIAIEPLRDLLAYLERDGSLVRAPGELWFDRGAVDDLRERVVAHLREHGALATPAYKDLIGTSRKYAVPLMELFDGEGLTLRRGDQRVAKKPL
jgi:selenocysteine-specific elongation factor